MQIVIEIDEARYKDIQRIAEVQLESNHFQTAEQIIAKGVPIEREPKTGRWIGIDEEPHEDYECDKCGYTISTYTANIEPHTEYKYCPNCGSKMVEPQESEG